MASKKKTPEVDVFAVKASAAGSSKLETISLSDPALVDEFNKVNSEIKALTARLDDLKSGLSEECKTVYADRVFNGKDSNFRVQGVDTVATWIVQDKSSGFSQEDKEIFAQKYGQKAADELLELDYSSFRINAEVMADPAKAAKVRKVLGELSAELGAPVVLPGSYKAAKGVIESVKKFCKDAGSLKDLIDDLKLTKFLRS